MNPLFADWYRSVITSPTEDMLKKRWDAIEKHSEEYKLLDYLELLRIYSGGVPRSETFFSSFQDAFKVADVTFALKDNAQELRVLSGVILLNHINHESSSNAADLISYGLQSLNFQRTDFVLPETIPLATKYLFFEGRRIRAMAKKPQIKLGTGTDEELSAQFQAAKANLGVFCEFTFQQIKALCTSISSECAKTTKAYQEDSNMLWWLMGEFSNDLKKTIRKMSAIELSVIAGKELSDLTQFIPGPPSYQAILNKFMSVGCEGSVEKIDLEQFKLPPNQTWRAGLVAGLTGRVQKFDDFVPVLATIVKLKESKENVSVRSSLNSAPIGKITALDLAAQIYHEYMILKILPKE